MPYRSVHYYKECLLQRYLSILNFCLLESTCRCTADYKVSIKHKVDGVTRLVNAYCDFWEEKLNFCYLTDGLSAENCPDARKSTKGPFYWTDNVQVCKDAAGMFHDKVGLHR